MRYLADEISHFTERMKTRAEMDQVVGWTDGLSSTGAGGYLGLPSSVLSSPKYPKEERSDSLLTV